MDINISVVIPVYNGEEFIEETITSVINQTVLPHEIIVVDDGSTDRSAEIAAQFGDRVTLIKQENQGRVISRKTGIEFASGNWVALLDADDLWVANKLEDQVEVLKTLPEDIVILHSEFGVIGKKESDQTRRYSFDIPKQFGLQFLFHNNAFATSTILLRKDVLDQVCPSWDLGRYRAQDYGLFLLMMAYGDAYFIDKVHSFYRIHETNHHNEHDFNLGVLKSRENVVKYVRENNLLSRLPDDWRFVFSESYFSVAWGYYQMKKYKEARPYFWDAYRFNRKNMKVLVYGVLLAFPARAVDFFRKILVRNSWV